MAWDPKVWRINELRIYRALLLAYPAEFRHEYGREMEQLFADRIAGEPPWRVWRAALLDVVTAAPREHLAILAADLRHGLRVLLRSPAATLVAVLTMALGIGATTAVFSLVNAVLLRSFPYPDVGKLTYVWTPNPRFPGTPLQLTGAVADYYEWRNNNRWFTDMALFNDATLHVDDRSGVPSAMGGAWVDGDFFTTMRAEPLLGRTIDSHDAQPGNPNVAVISSALWHSRFGGASNVLGQMLRVNREEYQVIGVMPEPFSYPHASDFPVDQHTVSIKRSDLWLPLRFTDKQKAARGMDLEGANVITRLKPGVTLQQAQNDIGAIEERLQPLYPEEMRGWKVYVQSFVDSAAGEVRTLMWLLLGAVGMVLLIACTNVASLLTAKAAGRIHEMGVRSALGAGRARLVRQMLTEALLMACAGGGLGALLAYGATGAVVRLNPGNIPRLDEISLDARVLGFACVVTVLTGFLFGLAPALSASRINLLDLLKAGGARGVLGAGKRLRGTLVLVQVGLALVLLTSAGLLVRSYVKLQGVDRGFSASTITVDVTRQGNPQQQYPFIQSLLQRVRALPGVKAAGVVSGVPLSNYESITFLDIEGYPNVKGQMTDGRNATAGYLAAMNIRLLSGRSIEDSDTAGTANVCVVSQGFAARYFPGQDAVGRVLHLGGDVKLPWTIVGVVADVRHSNLEDVPRPVVYQPLGQRNTDGRMDLAIRSSLPAAQTGAAVLQILREMSPEIPSPPIRTMQQLVDEASARRRFQTVVLTVFASIAVFLPLVGLYGLMAYSVKQRTGEIGIRMALGASRARVIAMVMREGVAWVAGGIAIGLAGAFALTRVAASFLYGVTATDPLTFVAAPLVLLAVAGAACAIPAWRAARISPIEALRYE